MPTEDGFEIQLGLYRRMTPQERLQISFRLYALTRTLVRQGIKHQHPDWGEKQVEDEVLRRFRLGAGIP
jgi:hypothetical protein